MDGPANYDIKKPKYHVMIVILVVIHLLDYGLCYSAPRRLKPQEVNEAPPQDETSSGISYTVAASFNTSSPGKPLGQITGIAINLRGNLVIFHRGSHRWDARSFDGNNRYNLASEGPIQEDTVIELSTDSFIQLSSWGSNFFFLPHGLTIDQEGSFWLTDVALHQVLKFKEGDLKTASLTLGERFVPGSDHGHFCKPTSVAVDSKSGNFFVADGYCNSRVMMFDSKGNYIREWGEKSAYYGSRLPLEFNTPHKIIMKQESPSPVVCVADRENGRVQCLDINSGEVIQSISGANALNIPLQTHTFNERVYSLSLASSCGIMFLVSGQADNDLPILAFGVGQESNNLMTSFGPPNVVHGISFTNSHDIVSIPDCGVVFVSEIGPNVVWKFVRKGSMTAHPSSLSRDGRHKDSVSLTDPVASNSKSTAVIISVMSLAVIVLVVMFRMYNKRDSYSSSSSSSHYLSWCCSLCNLSTGLPSYFIPRRLRMRMMHNSSNRDSFDLSRLLEDPERSGFNRVSTTELDADGDASGDSEVEEFNVTTVRANGRVTTA